MINDLVEMAKSWYGYGRWQAPYWFVGPEPGMVDDGSDDLEARCSAWVALGKSELIGCGEHHRGFGFVDWHSRRPPIQRTWGKLIRLLMAFKGEEPTLDSIREYQRDDWGASNGETCVIELCSMAAHDSGVSRNRDEFKVPRIAIIRERILQCQPAFVVMYGKKNQAEWSKIAGTEFSEVGTIIPIGRTTALFTEHPRWWSNDDARVYGKLLRQSINSFPVTSS